jgi:tRNA pseudouridine13 synthase
MEELSRPLPLMTAALAGVGGHIKATPEDFEVEELPAYDLSGEGPHVYLKIRKRDVASGWLMRQLSKRFGVPEAEIGIAGNKDRCAITTQWVSLPEHLLRKFDDEALRAPVAEGIEVIEVTRHQNKLKRGHLEGNRFTILIRDLELPPEEAMARAGAIAEAIRARGVANFYGPQRFGQGGQTLTLGLALARRQREGTAEARRKPFLRKLALNAVQSALFNRALALRLEEGWIDQVRAGDIVQKMPAGASFEVASDEVEQVQARLESGEVTLTGPMFGPRMRRPGQEVGQWEAALWSGAGLDDAALDQLGPGTRRPYVIHPQGLDVSMMDDATMRLTFSLPSGAYATIVAREFVKGDADVLTREEE